ncbi:hypothetical protein ACFQS2_03475 [Brachybacterium sp. GCM10030267]|uniref:hypothetical protein n=1 Tax=Brachybacterium sp. GCM10030267 TaxID=3273381 RepID=UPI0036234C69
MTAEHLWLQGKLRELCFELGYEAELESDVTGARVDLRVECTPYPYALEVQRVSTDFTARRKAREQNGMRTLWLLPESDRQKNTARGKSRRDPLFSEPCVRLGYRDGPGANAKVMTVAQLRADVWPSDGSSEVYLKAGVTVGMLSSEALTFYSSWLPLKEFLQQVLDGSRQWYPQRVIRGKGGHAWAGWLLVDDVTKYKAAVAAAKEERRLREEAATEAADAVVKDEEDKEREAQEQQVVVECAEENSEREWIGRVEQVERASQRASGSPGDDGRRPNAATTELLARKSWWRRLLGFLLG